MGQTEIALGEFWDDFIQALRLIGDQLLPEWPPELPPESESLSEAFWMAACREEMRTRQTLSGMILELLDKRELPAMPPLESWLLRRRIDWACQIGVGKFQQGVLPPVPLRQVLEWALVKTWESDGCQSMWLHAERGGRQHPAADWIDRK